MKAVGIQLMFSNLTADIIRLFLLTLPDFLYYKHNRSRDRFFISRFSLKMRFKLSLLYQFDSL